jgi:hypothetical protein
MTILALYLVIGLSCYVGVLMVVVGEFDEAEPGLGGLVLVVAFWPLLVGFAAFKFWQERREHPTPTSETSDA